MPDVAVGPTDTLMPIYAVHCFTCPHTVRALTPQTAHDQMEAHYTDKHAKLIATLVADLRPR